MPLSPLRLRLLVTSLLAVSFLGALDHTIVSTSLATIAGSLGALEHMGWIVVGYTLASTVVLPVLGKVADLLGPRAVFLGSLGAFLLASLACGFAVDMTMLIVARVIQGMGSAGVHLMSQTIVARVTTPRERPKYMSVVGAAFPIAILVGPVIGGVITDYWGWQWVFWINVPIGVLALVLALIAVPRLEPGGTRRFDYAGAASLTLTLVGVVLGVTWMGEPASAAVSAIAFGLSFVSLLAFFWIELRAAEPLVPLGRFRDRTVAAGVALSAIVGVGLFSVTAYLPTYFQMAYRTSATVSGLVPIATVFGMLVSNLVTGFLASRTGRYRVFPIIGTSLGAAGMFTMASLPPGAPLWVPMVVMFGVGIGTGAFMSLIVAVVQSAVPPTETGTMTATVNLARQIGSTLSTAVIGVVIATGVGLGLPPGLDASTLTPALVHGASAAVQAEVAVLYSTVFVPVFLGLGVTYVVGIVAAVLLPGGRLSDAHDPVDDVLQPTTA